MDCSFYRYKSFAKKRLAGSIFTVFNIPSVDLKAFMVHIFSVSRYRIDVKFWFKE